MFTLHLNVTLNSVYAEIVLTLTNASNAPYLLKSISRNALSDLTSNIFHKSLESVIKEVEMSTGKPLGGGGQGAPNLLEDGGRAPESAAYEAVLEAWRTAMTTNLARAAAVAAMNNNSGDNPQEGKIESSEMPLMSNMQVTFVGRPPTTTAGAVASPYLPNAIFMGGECLFSFNTNRFIFELNLNPLFVDFHEIRALKWLGHLQNH